MVQGGRLPGHRARLRRPDLVRHGHEHGVLDHHRQLSGRRASDWIEFNAQEFSSSAGSGTTWGVDHTGTQSNASSTTETFPSLSPSGSGELYFGYADAIGGYPSVGSTSGFTYGITSGANVVAYDTSVSSPSAYQPTASVSPAEVSLALATTFTATGSGGCTTGSGSGSGPIVTGISPCSGSTSGGTSVVITGSNFGRRDRRQVRYGCGSSYTVPAVLRSRLWLPRAGRPGGRHRLDGQHETPRAGGVLGLRSADHSGGSRRHTVRIPGLIYGSIRSYLPGGPYTTRPRISF